MANKLQLIKTTKRGEIWYAVKEIDEKGNSVYGSTEWFLREQEAVDNFNRRLATASIQPTEEIIKEIELPSANSI